MQIVVLKFDSSDILPLVERTFNLVRQGMEISYKSIANYAAYYVDGGHFISMKTPSDQFRFRTRGSLGFGMGTLETWKFYSLVHPYSDTHTSSDTIEFANVNDARAMLRTATLDLVALQEIANRPEVHSVEYYTSRPVIGGETAGLTFTVTIKMNDPEEGYHMTSLTGKGTTSRNTHPTAVWKLSTHEGKAVRYDTTMLSHNGNSKDINGDVQVWDGNADIGSMTSVSAPPGAGSLDVVLEAITSVSQAIGGLSNEA